jgi:hypothetical protein
MEMRATRLLAVGVFAMLFVVSTAVTSFAGGPYTVNQHINAHKEIEFDPNWVYEAEPCFVAVGDLTEVFEAEAHALAAGIDEEGNFVAPMHVEKTVTESVEFDAYDPALPDYTGHSTVHLTNFEDSPNAGFTNTVTLTGTDGSHLIFHETVHILVKSTGITLVVDRVTVSC